ACPWKLETRLAFILAVDSLAVLLWLWAHPVPGTLRGDPNKVRPGRMTEQDVNEVLGGPGRLYSGTPRQTPYAKEWWDQDRWIEVGFDKDGVVSEITHRPVGDRSPLRRILHDWHYL